jgi:CheY-like chemotaxis protein
VINLYIDDDWEDIEVFREAIASLDSQVLLYTAGDGVEGFQVLNELAIIPDFIFLDVNMPRMNGRDFLSRIKKTVRLRSIPVIMYSTTSQKDEIEAFKKSGAYDFIIKPNNFEKLHKILKETIYKDLSEINEQIRQPKILR